MLLTYRSYISLPFPGLKVKVLTSPCFIDDVWNFVSRRVRITLLTKEPLFWDSFSAKYVLLNLKLTVRDHNAIAQQCARASHWVVFKLYVLHCLLSYDYTLYRFDLQTFQGTEEQPAFTGSMSSLIFILRNSELG